MDGLSVDYSSLRPLAGDPAALGEALLALLGDRYLHEHGGALLHVFAQSPADYLFDLASADGLARADRTVAAWAVTPPRVARRDVAYQRGYPLQAWPDDQLHDRGHLIPHLSGGEFGPNIFRQDRALNRGWSEQGKRYRALEREAALPGSFYFGHLLYSDDSDFPSEIETGLLRGDQLNVERFNNRPPHA
jgi:hypothetical protein